MKRIVTVYKIVSKKGSKHTGDFVATAKNPVDLFGLVPNALVKKIRITWPTPGREQVYHGDLVAYVS